MMRQRILCQLLSGVLALSPALHSAENQSKRANPLYATPNDPPDLVTIANVNGTNTPVVIYFGRYANDYGVYVPPNSPVRLPSPSVKPGGEKFGSTALDLPDPDEHMFDPWDFPDPIEDFPLPDPPLPDPFDDPFDLPDPLDLPPLPDPVDDDIPMNDLPPIGSGTQTGFTVPGQQSLASQGSAAAPDAATFAPGGTQFFVANRVAGTVSKISLKGGATPGLASASTDTLQLLSNPASMVKTPNRRHLVVGNPGSLIIVNRATMQRERTISLPSNVTPVAMTISKDGQRLYCASYTLTDSVLYTVEYTTGKVLSTNILPAVAGGMAVSPDGNSLWVTSKFEGTLSVFDSRTGAQIASLRGFADAWGIAFNPQGTRVYVSGANDPYGTVRVVNPATFETLATINTERYTTSLLASPSGRHVFAVNELSGSISQIDTATNTVVRTIKIGQKAVGLQQLLYARQ